MDFPSFSLITLGRSLSIFQVFLNRQFLNFFLLLVMNFSNHCFSCISHAFLLLSLHSKHFIIFLLITLTSELFGSVLIFFFLHCIYFLIVSADQETEYSLIGSLASHEVAFLVLNRVVFLPEVQGPLPNCHGYWY